MVQPRVGHPANIALEGATRKAESPDRSPRLRVIISEEKTSAGTEFGTEDCQQMIKQLAGTLQQEVEQFIQDNYRELFSSKDPQKSPSLLSNAGLRSSLFNGCKLLEDLTARVSGKRLLPGQLYSLISRLQTSIDHFRLFLIRGEFIKEETGNGYDILIRKARSFQAELLSVIEQLEPKH